jgi:hypothetical protein
MPGKRSKANLVHEITQLRYQRLRQVVQFRKVPSLTDESEKGVIEHLKFINSITVRGFDTIEEYYREYNLYYDNFYGSVNDLPYTELTKFRRSLESGISYQAPAEVLSVRTTTLAQETYMSASTTTTTSVTRKRKAKTKTTTVQSETRSKCARVEICVNTTENLAPATLPTIVQNATRLPTDSSEAQTSTNIESVYIRKNRVAKATTYFKAKRANFFMCCSDETQNDDNLSVKECYVGSFFDTTTSLPVNVCPFCSALLFEDESSSMCCNYGVVEIPLPEYSEEYR